MRILHIEDIFYPEAGYLVNILAKYEVLAGHEAVVLTSTVDNWHPQRRAFWGDSNIERRDYIYSQSTGVKIVRYHAKKEFSDRLLFDKEYYKIIDKIQPDVLFIHNESGFSAFHYLLRVKKNKFPIVFTSHMLDVATNKKLRHLFYFLYKLTFTRIIKKNDIKIIKTQDDPYLQNRLGIPVEQTPFISFGTDTLTFFPDANVKHQMREQLSISQNSFVVVVTGKLTEAKGGLILAESFRKKFDSIRNVALITVGTPTDDEYDQMVSHMLDQSENQIVRIPTQKYSELAKYYQCADISVFAKQCSLSFYDAQACGLPVILEDNPVNHTRIKHHNGKTFTSGDSEALRNAIYKFINMEEKEFKQYQDCSIKDIKDNYDYKLIAQRYLSVLEEAVDSFKSKQIGSCRK